jgi:hypothetical protein
VKSSSDDLPKIRARFKAKHLHALREIIANSRGRSFCGPAGLYLEPCEQGGVLIIATDGHALAALRDPDGEVNKPFKVHLPKAFVDRCAPPAPVAVFCEGPDEIELPEWAQPGEVYLYEIAAMLFSQMNHPKFEDLKYAPVLANLPIETGNHWRETDYRVEEPRETFSWRRPLEAAPAPGERFYLQPSVFATFQPIFEQACRDADKPLALALEPRENMVIRVFIDGFPDFVGVVIGMTPFTPPPLPLFAAEPAKTPREQGESDAAISAAMASDPDWQNENPDLSTAEVVDPSAEEASGRDD